MRRFHDESFSIRLADGLSSAHLNIPDKEASNALSYVKQFIQRQSGSAYLHRGYVPEDYIDALIRIRDVNSSRQFSRAVEALGTDGGVSQEAEYDEFTLVRFEPNRDLLNELNDAYYEAETEDAQKIVRTIQDLIRINNSTVDIYLPDEILSQIDPISSTT